MILTNAYNRIATNGDRMKLDRDQMRERMLMNLFEWQIQVATETGNIKDVETLTRIYERMKPEVNIDINIKNYNDIISLEFDFKLNKRYAKPENIYVIYHK